MTDGPRAREFRAELVAMATDEQRRKYERFFPGDDTLIGVRMGDVFGLATRSRAMPVAEIEVLLEDPVHEVRAGACSIMGKAATHRTVAPARHGELYDLYLRRHDRIDTWDLVDLAAHQVVGSWLIDKPRDPLDRLAVSGFWPERRTAIVATAAFLRRGETADTMRLASTLAGDDHPLVQKGTGWMLRYAGDVDRAVLVAFLDRHARSMGRVAVRGAVEKLDPPDRRRYIAESR
ncbi:MAG: DNA alkylation repair protein [Ilumatobacteraceae bacterium]